MAPDFSNATAPVKWLTNHANELTYNFNRCLREERESAFWPITKIVTCRVLTIPFGVAATVAHFVLYCIFPCQNQKCCGGRDYRWKLVATNYNATAANIIELFHGVKALFFGYTPSAIFTPKQIEDMRDKMRLQPLYDLKAPDFQLNNGNRTYLFHKEMLSLTKVDSFKVLLTGNFGETELGEWNDVELSDKAMTAFRQFVYFGEVLLDPATAKELIVFAQKHEYKALENRCLDRLKKRMDAEVISDMLTFAEENNLQSLQNACFDFIRKNPKFLPLIENSFTRKIAYTEKKSEIVSPSIPTINEDFADVEFVSVDNNWTLKAHSLILFMQCPILLTKFIPTEDESLKISTFSQFSKEAVEDFLYYLYWKQLPNDIMDTVLVKRPVEKKEDEKKVGDKDSGEKVEVKKEQPSTPRLKNFIEVIEHLKDDTTITKVGALLKPLFLKQLDDYLKKNQDPRFHKIFDVEATIEEIQKLADKLQLSSVINQCVKMRVTLIPSSTTVTPELIQPIRFLTDLDLSTRHNFGSINEIFEWIEKRPEEAPLLKIIRVGHSEASYHWLYNPNQFLQDNPRIQNIICSNKIEYNQKH